MKPTLLLVMSWYLTMCNRRRECGRRPLLRVHSQEHRRRGEDEAAQSGADETMTTRRRTFFHMSEREGDKKKKLSLHVTPLMPYDLLPKCVLSPAAPDLTHLPVTGRLTTKIPNLVFQIKISSYGKSISLYCFMDPPVVIFSLLQPNSASLSLMAIYDKWWLVRLGGLHR